MSVDPSVKFSEAIKVLGNPKSTPEEIISALDDIGTDVMYYGMGESRNSAFDPKNSEHMNAIKLVFRNLTHDNPEVQKWALDVIEALGFAHEGYGSILSPKDIELLLPSLDHENPKIRANAINVLSHIADAHEVQRDIFNPMNKEHRKIKRSIVRKLFGVAKDKTLPLNQRKKIVKTIKGFEHLKR